MKRKIDEVYTFNLDLLYESLNYKLIPHVKKEKKDEDEKIITTHDGFFHADDVIAVSLMLILDEKIDTIIRTRNEDIIKESFCCIDVGGVYNKEKLRFDHHQIGIEEFFDGKSKIPLSSSGLVYRDFGRDIIKKVLKSIDLEFDEIDIEFLYKKMYYQMFMEVDAIDNGVKEFSKYSITSISPRISSLNPTQENASAENINENFRLAVSYFIDEFFKVLIHDLFSKWLYQRKLVYTNIKEYIDTNKKDRILEFDSWVLDEHILETEEELNLHNHFLFSIYKDDSGKEVCYKVRTIPKENFVNRKSLLTKEDFEKKGVKGCIFVHKNLFIGSNKTKDGAIQMALLSIE